MADFTIRGPGLRKLKKLENRLSHMGAIKRAIAVNQAEEVIDLIKQGFRDEKDPYGKPWKKRKRETTKTRGRKVLSGETSNLKTGWKRTRLSGSVTGNAFYRVSSSVAYASPHQRPKRGKRPRRMMVPHRKRGFPRSWRKNLREVTGDAINDYLTKGKR